MKHAQSIQNLRHIAENIIHERQHLIVGNIDKKLEHALENARIDAICAGVNEPTIHQIIQSCSPLHPPLTSLTPKNTILQKKV